MKKLIRLYACVNRFLRPVLRFLEWVLNKIAAYLDTLLRPQNLFHLRRIARLKLILTIILAGEIYILASYATGKPFSRLASIGLILIHSIFRKRQIVSRLSIYIPTGIFIIQYYYRELIQ